MSPATAGAKAERKILYYRNPMGLPDTSPVPKKDPMGMDYIAVYDGEEPDTGSTQIKISVDKVQKLGVRVEPAAMRSLDKVIRAVGRVEVDERRVFAIAPRFEGWVERLFVNATGQPVSKGQALFEVYSPELVSAQREYAIANEAVKALKDAGDDPQAGMRRLADSSLARLRNWDISDEQVRTLTQSGEARRTLTFRSPVSGIVMEKKAVQGMRFMPGDSLYQIADLSSVWIMADVNEQDIGLIRTGSKAKVSIGAYPDQKFEGTITYVYPTLKPETRTVSVRLEIGNPRQLLKPAMFAEVELPVGGKGKVLTVPNSAVIDSGTRRIVLVQLAEGRFEPREVKLGARTRRLRRGNGRREGRRTGRRGGELPDRRRKQSQGRHRRVRRLWPKRRSRRAQARPRHRHRRLCPRQPRARAPRARSHRQQAPRLRSSVIGRRGPSKRSMPSPERYPSRTARSHRSIGPG